MIDIVSKVLDFEIIDCVFENETLSDIYIFAESIHNFDFKNIEISNINKHKDTDYGVRFIVI